ncbi:polygalacturonase-like isoform X3 [Nymphaea colorata]|uniref:polygalacturonase-like isoform X2 n=1 Tax=Nymphaea colorata TaxID=210225 RepID=UPI00214EDEEC|nr:polygalacturonase-like isoform X2 [Nymphaea colorata]XP_049932524.1 polygalacturonase-like isoform X3 [Nymphaea colorata]
MLMANDIHVSTILFSLFILPSFFLHSTDGAATYNVLSYGAKSDGATDNSAAFLKAWSAVCAQSDAAVTMYVPSGSFLLHPTMFTGPCKSKSTVVQIDGNLVASSDYNLYEAAGYWLKFKNVQGLTFEGGQLDAKGSALWECKAQKTNCPDGARSLVFNDAKDIKLKGFTSLNSELFNIVIDTSSNVQVDGLNIQSAATSPNTDGIHVEQSSGVTITNTYIKTGDDCISIGQGTQNLWIEKVTCGPGHGISIGSLGKSANEAGVQNVTVKNVAFSGTTNGLRIKSWERSSNGFAKQILFDGATMDNVKNPIIIDQHYCPHNEGCPTENSGVKISNVVYKNINGTSATQVAVDFSCSASAPCQGISMANVQLTYKGQPAKSSCEHAFGSATGTMVPSSCLQSSSSSNRRLMAFVSNN